MRGDWSRRSGTAELPDDALWRTSCLTDSPEDEAARFLDLAGFTEGRLDADDRERVAEWLAADPVAAADVAAAQALAAAAEAIEDAPEAVVARAGALVAGGEHRPGKLVAFPTRAQRARPRLPRMAGWGSLAAAVVMASWLGFTLGMDTSRSFAPPGRAGDESFMRDLLNPSASFLPDLTDGAQT